MRFTQTVGVTVTRWERLVKRKQSWYAMSAPEVVKSTVEYDRCKIIVVISREFENRSVTNNFIFLVY